MNKIFNVNLGGYPFTIDENAYHQLNQYLDTIRRHFSASDGCDEILEDIEARMAELFNEKIKTKAIIGIKDLDDVISIMGRPEDFGATSIEEDTTEEYTSSTSTRDNKARIKTGKRLFRDGEDRVVGGVCSGIAAFFGIEDPLWVRLGWIVATMMLGVPLILYPILWLIVPEARTAGDKLSMKGEPVNIDNIAKTIEEEFEDISGKINEFTKDLGKKKTLKPPHLRRRMPLRKGFL